MQQMTNKKTIKSNKGTTKNEHHLLVQLIPFCFPPVMEPARKLLPQLREPDSSIFYSFTSPHYHKDTSQQKHQHLSKLSTNIEANYVRKNEKQISNGCFEVKPSFWMYRGLYLKVVVKIKTVDFVNLNGFTFLREVFFLNIRYNELYFMWGLLTKPTSPVPDLNLLLRFFIFFAFH